MSVRTCPFKSTNTASGLALRRVRGALKPLPPGAPEHDSVYASRMSQAHEKRSTTQLLADKAAAYAERGTSLGAGRPFRSTRIRKPTEQAALEGDDPCAK